jgi:hypothetical protein
VKGMSEINQNLEEAVRITENDYDRLFKNGARKLFEWRNFKFLDGDNYDLTPQESYIIIKCVDDDFEFYKVDVRTMYEFITTYHYANKMYLDEIMEGILNYINVIKEGEE